MNVHHHKIGETNEPSMYRITDNAVSFRRVLAISLLFRAFLQVAVDCLCGTVFFSWL